nr:MAG: Transposase [Bacteriophage sp.]
MYVIKIITLAIIYILIFIGVHRKKIYNSVSGIIDLDLKVKYPYLVSRKGILNLNKDYLNGVTIKELKQKYNITHIHRYVKETKKRYRLGHDRVRELIRDKAKGYSNKELGEKYKLSKASISHYLNRSFL